MVVVYITTFTGPREIYTFQSLILPEKKRKEERNAGEKGGGSLSSFLPEKGEQLKLNQKPMMRDVSMELLNKKKVECV